ncbi:ABC transporter substrate-binding protein [Nocardioides sp. zg-579]|uniref:ABC transporter substrate-binding protein n=1 Tax=Nocardioides marmotae TaxID=2663857 RepID=A0A6I3JFW8_9ACTN|nr:iron-siderophore ABC transporter substrate-binding protein [Nocardioides marmotae]MCR6033506.1 ABC transporter substrate-binding protein [Gordonia jinghuaiqii]MTB97164.1 ABC transporter substrate-binding protein [Nocardioides marmotae]QKE00811.1 iron-siderophore ABC transporter substrate-binding protein [Nocardioides marmotae]
MTSLRPLTRRGRVPRALLPVGALLLALPLAACGSESDSEDKAGGGTSPAAEAFEPVTIEHAFGSTEIEEQPERVATWGWGSGDAALALGVTPVAMPKYSYGADENGRMPWQTEAIEELGGEEPALLSETAEAPIEEIAAAQPDLILANYSGITEGDYEKLSKIAPTVAYPEEPWATPWREVITTVGEALGKADEADQLLEDIDAQVAAAAEEHPEFAGKTIAAVAIDPSAFYVYRGADPRVEFLEDLGFELAPSVDELDTADETFYYMISTEEADKLTSDVLVSYSPNEDAAAEVDKSAAAKAMQQFQDDTVARVVGESLVSSVSPPTALSLTWGLDDFIEALVPAVEKADAQG